MTFRSLSDYIDFLDDHNGLEVVRGAHWEDEIGALTTLMIRNRPAPALLFDEIIDHEPGYRVLSNALTSPFQWTAAMGFEPVTSKRDAVILQKESSVGELKEPVMVSSSPVLDNVQSGDDVDVTKFPAPKWNENDGGRYIGTADVVITRHAETERLNAGVYRIQVHGRDEVTVMISPSHDGLTNTKSYLENGEPAPVVISCGHPPDIFIGASESISLGEHGANELEYIGARRGEPLELIEGEVTGLPIPADSDIVLEGHILPDREPLHEGPFGEWTGYMGGDQYLQPMKVERVYHRDNPIILGVQLVRPPAQIKSEIRNAAEVWRELESSGVPGIKEVNTFPAGLNGWWDVVSIKQQYGGHSVQVGMQAMTCIRNTTSGRFTVVVDDDINVYDQDHVLWAMASRCEPAEDIHIVDNLGGNTLNPRLSPENREKGDYRKSKVVIDATRPYYWRDEYPAVNEPSAELLEQTKERWVDLLSKYERSELYTME